MISSSRPATAIARRILVLAMTSLAATLLLLAGASAALAAGPVTFSDGLAVVEAEDFDAKVPRGGKDWATGQSPSGSVGAAMKALPDTGARITSSIATTSPELAYRVSFPAAGTYQLWLRMYGISNGNTLHAGIDGAATAQNVAVQTNAWRWVKTGVSVPSAGEHTLNVWMREDGISLDRFLLTTSTGFTPSGNGPAATPRDGGEPVPDTTPPTVTARQPAAGATGVAVGADVVATFSEAMNPATLTASSFTLAPSAGGPAVSASIAASAGNTVFTLNPSADLAAGTEYTATVTTGATDAAGNALASAQTWSFTTAAAPPPPPPPGTGAVTFVSGQAVVEGEDFDAKAARAGHDWLTGQSPAGSVGGAVRVLPDTGLGASGDVAATSPQLSYRVDFPAPGTYYLWLRGSGPDGAGNSVHIGLDGSLGPSYLNLYEYGPWVWVGSIFSGGRATLSVPSAGEHTVNVWMREDGFSVDRLLLTTVSSFTPSGTGPAATPRQQTADTTPPTLTGRQPAPGATGVAVGADVVATFSEAMAPASVTGGAFTLAPTAGGPAVAASVTASAGNTVFTLNPSADLAPGTQYTATVGTGATDAAGNALASAQTWSFTTAAPPPPDTTPPTLTGRQPAPGATGVAVGADVVATFSEAMAPASVTGGAFTLAPTAGGPAVAASVTASAGNTIFTLNPSADLAPGTQYTATVGTGATDAAGNALASAQTWSFTTAAPPPPSGTGAVTFSGGLAVVEAEDFDAKVARSGKDWLTGQSPAGSVAAAMKALPDSGSRLTGSVATTSPELAYRISFPTAGTHQLWLRMYGISNGNTVHAGVDGAVTAQNVAVQTGAWRWVKVSVTIPAPGEHTVHVWMREDGVSVDRLLLASSAGFTPSGDGPAVTPRENDTTPPTLTGRQPAPGATGVAVGADVVATFSEAMSPATLTASSFTLVPSAGGPAVSASIAASAGNTVFTLDPAASLAFATEYTATLTSAATDIAGNAFAGASWSFTTAEPPPPDTTPPTLTGRTPAAGATGVAPGANVVATFSEAMDPATVAMTLAPSAGGPSVSATVTPSAGGTVFTLNPAATLALSTSYTVRIAATAADLAGNPIGAEQSWSFTTSSTSNLVATDIAVQAGLRDSLQTQGENCIFDFDGDGVRDIFLSVHGIGWRLMRGRPDGTFVEVERFPSTDRHGCAIGDFGGITASGAYTGPDGRPDIYTTIGACQGTCTTPFPNELWLQRPEGDYLPPGQDQLEGPVPSGNKANAGSDAAKAFGVADERGRGREPLGFDIDVDGLTDLFVGNEESQLYTSANRLFRTEPDGDMSVVASSAVVQEVGSLASTAADIDADGRVDLANVATSRLYVFRNTPSGFQDVTSAWGLPTSGDMKDIEFADLNGDGRLDAIMANHSSVKVRLNRDGRFPTEDYSRSLTQGRDLAVGDADGDGDLDVYVVVGQNETYDDLLLRNGGGFLSTGKWDFTTIPIPQADEGEGDTAQALPNWNGTNRAAFLVNNGKWDGRGPRQLIFMVPA